MRGHRLLAAVAACTIAAVPAFPFAAAQAPPSPPAGTGPDLQQQIASLQATIEAGQAQRGQVLAELDEVQAQIADLDSEVAAAGLEVARAEAAVLAATTRLSRTAAELYKNPQRMAGMVLDATSMNEILVARKYLTVQTRVESVSLEEVDAAKDEQQRRRDDLAGRRSLLASALEEKERAQASVEASVQEEQRLLAELQQRLAIAQASQPGAIGNLPPASVQDCPGSGAGSVGGNPAKNAQQAAIYGKYPFGPVGGIPPGFVAVGAPTVEVHSWYGDCFHGHATASGAVYDQNLYTTAALKYPLGTFLVVTYQPAGRSIMVLVNDRGPYVKGRSLDLSAAAAYYLGTADRGVATVTAQVVRPTY